jgi:hypothetical protein
VEEVSKRTITTLKIYLFEPIKELELERETERELMAVEIYSRESIT